MPMANKAAIECADSLMKMIMKNDYLFGGKVFLGLGDFRQVAPIVSGTGLTSSYQASIRSSFLWSAFQILRLHDPIRNVSDLEYSEWIDLIGEGSHNDEEVSLDLIATVNNLDEVIQFLFPPEILFGDNKTLLAQRAFLSPLNIYVDDFNDQILNHISDDEGNS